jgi:hypothetical protein
MREQVGVTKEGNGGHGLGGQDEDSKKLVSQCSSNGLPVKRSGVSKLAGEDGTGEVSASPGDFDGENSE